MGGYLLQRVAFPTAGTTNQQILATVYVKNLPAHVSLKAEFSPEQAADLGLAVTVTGPTREPDPSVLVVQCRSEQGKAKQPTAALWSESASRPQELGQVLVTSQVKTSWTDTFSCSTGLSERGETATAVLKGQDVNLSLPILEQNPNGPASLAAAPLYAETASTGGSIANLVEVPGTPGSPCPAASPPASSP